jgi:type 1 fimbria pilin
MPIRINGWSAVVAIAILVGCGHTHAGEKQTTQIDISGTLTKPPCTASFPSSQSVELPAVSLNSLSSDSSDWTEVALNFKCTKGSQVHLRLNPGNGAFDSSTLRTTLDNLGLRTRLVNTTGILKVADLKLGEQLIFPVADSLLNLTLSVRPVKTGEVLPAVGSYSSTLLMEIIYL